MYKNKKIVAIIPARGGSKGIKNKNIRIINNKPLVAYSIESALKCKYIDYTLVSTDSKEIAEISKSYGAQVPFLRPKEIATDSSKTIDVLVHAMNFLANSGNYFDYVMLLQPTQPIRAEEELEKTIEIVVDRRLPSLVSICEVEETPILMRTIDTNKKLKRVLNINSTVRRQDFPKFYKVNGSIYINKIEDLNLNTSLNDNEYGYIMPKNHSVDIDTEDDLKLAEKILKG